MHNLDGMNLRMLQPSCPDSTRMISWLDKDINHALANGFLHSLHFCVCKDKDGKDMIEEYTYTFSYNKEGLWVPAMLAMYMLDRCAFDAQTRKLAGKASLKMQCSNNKARKTVKCKGPPVRPPCLYSTVLD
jgi:hypothetical protein